MDSFSVRLEAAAKSRIDREIEHETGIIVAGSMSDFATYRYHAGRLAGLQRAKALIDDAVVDSQQI